VVAATSWQVMPAGANQSDWQFMPYADTAGAPSSDRATVPLHIFLRSSLAVSSRWTCRSTGRPSKCWF
jgi:hypothetical protein